MKKVKLKTQELREALDSIHKKAMEVERITMEVNLEMATFWIKFKQIHGQGNFHLNPNTGEIFKFSTREVLDRKTKQL